MVYVLDADTVFAGFVETLQRAMRRPQSTGIHPMVLVGIAPGSRAEVAASRLRDFTAGASATEPSLSPHGGAARFLSFLQDELAPQLEPQLAVDASRRGLVGHSMAGYFCLWALASGGSRFACHLAASPSVWWDPAALADALRAGVAATQSPRVYLSVGEWEGQPAPWQAQLAADPAWLARRARRDMAGSIAAMAARLQALLPADAVQFDQLAGEDHGSALLPAVARSLRFMAGAAS